MKKRIDVFYKKVNGYLESETYTFENEYEEMKYLATHDFGNFESIFFLDGIYTNLNGETIYSVTDKILSKDICPF